MLAAAAEPSERAFLQHAQQLDLGGRRHLADFVQKERAAIGQLEASLTPVGGARERALLVPEDLAFEQRLGNGRAVDRDERKRGARTELVDRLRHQFLARARLAADEDRCAGRRRLLDHVVDLPHLGAVADHRPERAVFPQLTPQRLHLAKRFQPLDNLVEQDLQALNVDRLGQVVVRAFLHRFDGRLDRTLRRQEQGRDVCALRLKGAQQAEPVQSRHDQVRDDNCRSKARHFFKRVLAVGCRVGDESPAPHEQLEPDTRSGIVFDDKDALGRYVGNGVIRLNCAAAEAHL